MNEIDPIIIEILKKRGISEENEILEFLSEKPQATYDPFLLLNLEAGVDLILDGIGCGKKICIYGDYDADGITSISLLYQVLSRLTDRLDYYVPCRFDEGYGLNKLAIDIIKERGNDMIVTVDCGSVSYEEVEHAKAIGLDIIVTDHHSITNQIADCILINPKQPGCTYPFKELAGCGVAFKLAQGIQRKSGLPRSILTDVLDLVAIGTIGDIVPLIGENRTLVKYGMKELNRLRRSGLRMLIDMICKKKGTITSENVAFIIVPHINAVGRMFNAMVAVELLISDDEERLRNSVDKLVESNRERKRIQERTYKDCIKIVERHLNEKLFLMICSDDVHEGIAGIVAGKIKDKYHKPTVIITPSNGYYKGTGRCIEKINLYEFLKDYEQLFNKFGGHAGACGFLMKAENLDILKRDIEGKVQQLYAEDHTIFDRECYIDLELEGKDITVAFGERLECLAPFGNCNKKPLFLIRGVTIKNLASIGEDGNHVRFIGCCPDGSAVSCVLFNKAEACRELLHANQPVQIIGSIEAQQWNGNKKVQFFVEELKF